MQLDLANNQIKTLEALTPLFSLSLEELYLLGNPVAELPNYRAHLFEKYYNIHPEFPLSRFLIKLIRTETKSKKNFKIWTKTKTMNMMRTTANKNS
jgi:Leucine-rich repeat (LRR) protein